MAMHPLAGKPAPESILENIPRLVSNYYSLKPDPSNPEHAVAFGTSGHRGSSNAFTLIKGISWRSARPFANTGSHREFPARCSWALIPMRYPNPP